MKKIIGIYQVMLPYRVGTYERISRLSGYEFELLHGKTSQGTKKKNYEGTVSFNHSVIWCFYIPFKTNNSSSTLQIAPFLFFSLIRKSPDIIFCEGVSNIFNASIAFIYAKLFRKKIIWWSLGSLYNRTYKGVRLYLQYWIDFVERRVDAIFTYSTQGENYFLSKSISKNKIFKGINVIDTDKRLNEISHLRYLEKRSGFNIVFVGAIIKEKKIEILLEAADRLSFLYKDVYLHIIGDGDYVSEVKKYASQKKYLNVEFYGNIYEKLSSFLLQFHVLVLPGLGGLAIADGMIQSLPVISGIADGTELDLINDECGFVTRDMNPDYLFNKLKLLYEHPDLVKTMGEAAFCRITGKYSINHYMYNLDKCFYYVSNKK